MVTVSCCREKPDEERVGAGIESLLLRGCTIRNTDHAVGFVVYAGTSSVSSADSTLSFRLPCEITKITRRELARIITCEVFYFINAILLKMFNVNYYIKLYSPISVYFTQHSDLFTIFKNTPESS